MNDLIYSYIRQFLAFLVGFLIFYLIEPYNFIVKNIICTVFFGFFYYCLDRGYKKWKKRYTKKCLRST